jgi:hypothetical protein
LQAELDRLNRTLEVAASNATRVLASPIQVLDAPMKDPHFQTPSGPTLESLPFSSPKTLSQSLGLRAHPSNPPEVAVPGTVSSIVSSARKIDDLEFEACQLNDCIYLCVTQEPESLYVTPALIVSRFMNQYAPKLLILDGPMDLNACCIQSPLLFWTMVAVGSRTYSKDPTMLALLGPKVIALVEQAILQRENAISKLQAFLILCVWPMPVDSMHKDISPILVGAMVNLAQSIGLHVPGVGEDFLRTTVPSCHNDTLFRAKLWISIVITAQRQDKPHMWVSSSPV